MKFQKIIGGEEKVDASVYAGKFEKLQDKTTFSFAILKKGNNDIKLAIPLDSPSSFRSSLVQLYLYKGEKIKNRILIAVFYILGMKLVKTLFTRQMHIVVNDSDNVFDFIASQLGVESMSFSIYRTAEKYVLPLFKRSNGQLLGYAKVYLSSNKKANIENEVQILRNINLYNLSEIETPNVIFSGRFNKCFVSIVSSSPNIRRINGVTERHFKAINSMVASTGREMLFEESNVPVELERVKSLLLGTPNEPTIEPLIRRATEALQGRKFVFSLSLREFPYFHLFKKEKFSFMVDWEHARFDFCPLFDLYSLLISQRLFERETAGVMYLKRVEHLFFNGQEEVYGRVFDLSETIGATREDSYWFFYLFLIDQLSIHLSLNHDVSAKKIIYVLKEIKSNKRFSIENWLR